MGLVHWLFGPLGLGTGTTNAGWVPEGEPAEDEVARFHETRRAVIAYLRAVRPAIRLTTEIKKTWFVELGKLYGLIATSPAKLILSQAGEIGYEYQPQFRQALAVLQSAEPPEAARELHESLVGWISQLEAACLCLKDAGRLNDQRQLGDFREHLNRGRQAGRRASHQRAHLIANFRLVARAKPTPKRSPLTRRALPAPAVQSA